MQIGQMNRRFNLLVPNTTRDVAGQLVQSAVEPWRRYLRGLPAKFGEVSGGEAARGVKVEATTTAVFVIRYLRAIEPTMRIELLQEIDVSGGQAEERYRYFEIVSILDRRGDKQWLEVQAAEVQ